MVNKSLNFHTFHYTYIYIESYCICFEKQLPYFLNKGTVQMEMQIYVNTSNKNNFVGNIIQRLCLLGSGLEDNLKIYYSIV